jgi:hypothetical protein
MRVLAPENGNKYRNSWKTITEQREVEAGKYKMNEQLPSGATIINVQKVDVRGSSASQFTETLLRKAYDASGAYAVGGAT